MKLNFKRFGFQIVVWENYLYVVGGWRRGKKNEIDPKDKINNDIIADSGFLNTN